MSYTAHQKQHQKQEYFDSPQVLDKKVTKLAEWILKSQHMIAFTGAGISTSSGIPDYRSGMQTVLKTGPGVWQKAAQQSFGKNSEKCSMSKKTETQKNVTKKPMANAIPSYTHMALVAMEEKGMLKYLISQNTDGLHLRSGFNPEKLAELHGNRCIRKCTKCKNEYLRDYDPKELDPMQCKRKCQNPECKGAPLEKSTIDFKQSLPEKQLERSFEEAQKSDLCLVLGSSLTVKPACEIPMLVANKKKKNGYYQTYQKKDVSEKEKTNQQQEGNLVIINIQKTNLDYKASLKINALIDHAMEKLCEKIQLKVSEFVLYRRVHFYFRDPLDKKQESSRLWCFRGVDKLLRPFNFFREVFIAYDEEPEYRSLQRKQPYVLENVKPQGDFPEKKNQSELVDKHNQVYLSFEFFDLVGETDFELLLTEMKTGVLKIGFSHREGKWITQEWVKEGQ